MKIFFPVLVAILAAAAIFWLIYAYQQQQQALQDSKDDLQSAQTTIDDWKKAREMTASPSPGKDSN
jgi:uncharacterized protein HemX